MEVRDESEDLIYDLKVVSGARFAMAARLEFSANAKSFLINGITAISIFISAGLLVSDGDKFPVDAVAIALVGISIFTMWMNLDRTEGEMRLRSNGARKCAVLINEIRKKMQHGELSRENALKKYEEELLAYSDNHRDADREYARYKLRKKHKKAEDTNWFTSVMPWIGLCAWYPFVFVAWGIVVYLISLQIVGDVN